MRAGGWETIEEKKDFRRRLLRLVLPITFQQIMLGLVSASDALMLGMLTQDALSAVSLASQVSFVENMFLAALTTGLSMLAAQYWGKGDVGAVERVFAYAMKMTAILAAIFFLAGLFVPRGLMRVFTADERLIAQGAVYLRTVSPAFLLTGLSQVYQTALKNSGRAVTASAVSCTSVVVNIALNAVFIFGLLGLPRLEIAGAALATVLARVMEAVWCVLETARPGRAKLRWGNLVHDDAVLRRDFWRYTLPVLGNQIVWGVGFTMYSVIMGHLGSDAVAANSVANIVKNLLSSFCLGLGLGGGILLGNELGAGRLDRAKEYGGRLCHLALGCGVISALVLLAATPLVLAVTDLSPQAAFYLKWMLVMCTYNMVGMTMNITTINGVFPSGGDSRFGFYCDTVTMWCFSVPAGFLAAFVLKLPVLAVFFIINLDEMVKLPAVYRHYKKYLWVRDLTVREEQPACDEGG